MKVILLENVAKIGRKYEIKEVAPGYASNYLFPRNLALHADTSKTKQIVQLQKRAEHERKLQEELLAKNITALEGVTVTIKGKNVNEQGHLYEGIHKNEIIAALEEQAKIAITEDMLELSEPIKSAGSHELQVQALDQKAIFALVIEGNPLEKEK